jgi:hypothetical protein
MNALDLRSMISAQRGYFSFSLSASRSTWLMFFLYCGLEYPQTTYLDPLGDRHGIHHIETFA